MEDENFLPLMNLKGQKLSVFANQLQNHLFYFSNMQSYIIFYFHISFLVECLPEILGSSYMFSTLLPMTISYIGPVATMDPRVISLDFFCFKYNANKGNTYLLKCKVFWKYQVKIPLHAKEVSGNI